ncbi:uncharacterized protein CHSO_2909 [Chryseobacterium sp. StRB126]|nr:uncharacterized protein CHSO_2909 [Chryseobacterium sp. StRB126]
METAIFYAKLLFLYVTYDTTSIAKMNKGYIILNIGSPTTECAINAEMKLIDKPI